MSRNSMTYHPPQGRLPSWPPMGDNPAASEKPRSPQHSAKWYATRKDPAFLKKFGTAVRESYRREERKTRTLAAKLNATEPSGIWMTQRQYGAAFSVSNTALYSRAKTNRWPRQDGAGKRVPLFLVPQAVAAEMASKAAAKAGSKKTARDVAVIEAPPVHRPWWRRLFGWLGS